LLASAAVNWRWLMWMALASGLVEPLSAQGGIDPVHYFQLIYALPRTPEGYTSTKPAGAKIITNGVPVTEASRQYGHKKRPPKVIRIKITDGAFQRGLYDEFADTKDFNREWADGYYKGYKIDAYPVRERYSKYKREATLRGVVEGRFIVEITGYDVGPSELVEWWRMIDIRRLVALH